MKRVGFSFVDVPGGETPVALATLTFTPPVSGVVALSGRGFCNITPLAGEDVAVVVTAVASLASPFPISSIAEWGVVGVPEGAVSTSGWPYQGSFNSLTLMNVTGGVTYTRYLAAMHDTGSGTDECTGTFTAQLFSGYMP